MWALSVTLTLGAATMFCALCTSGGNGDQFHQVISSYKADTNMQILNFDL